MDRLMFAVAMVMVCMTSSAVGTDELLEEGGNLTCFDCAGEVGDIYSNCGEVIDPEADLNTVNCTGICTKQVQYFIDQKIRVERNCSYHCEEGCTMVLGTSTCVHCCQTDRCNGASTTSPILMTIAFAFMIFMAT